MVSKQLFTEIRKGNEIYLLLLIYFILVKEILFYTLGLFFYLLVRS